MATFPPPHLLFPESPTAFGSSTVHSACTSSIAVLPLYGGHFITSFSEHREQRQFGSQKDRAQTHRTPEDKGKGGSHFHFSVLVTLLAGQGNQALPKLVHQPPARPSPAGADAPILIRAGWCPRCSCWLLSWVCECCPLSLQSPQFPSLIIQK